MLGGLQEGALRATVARMVIQKDTSRVDVQTKFWFNLYIQ